MGPLLAALRLAMMTSYSSYLPKDAGIANNRVVTTPSTAYSASLSLIVICSGVDNLKLQSAAYFRRISPASILPLPRCAPRQTYSVPSRLTSSFSYV
jgi:hypothetical protein